MGSRRLPGQLPATQRTKSVSQQRLLLSIRTRQHRALLLNASAWIGTLRPTRTGPTNHVNHSCTASRLHGFPGVLRRRHHQTAVAQSRRRPCAHSVASSRLLRLTHTTPSRALDCLGRQRVDEVLSLHTEDDSNWVDAWRVQQSSLVSRHDTLLAHLYPDREPTPDTVFRRHIVLRHLLCALIRKNRRPFDKLQLLFVEPWSDEGLRPSHSGKSPQPPVARGLCSRR